MLKTLAAAALATTLGLSPLAAFAQSDMSAGTMPDKAKMAPKKPMTKHHSMHRKAMSHPDMTKGGDMQPKM